MASLAKEGNGWRIRFYDAEGNRKTVRLGRCAKKDAQTVANTVERLVACRRLGTTPDAQTVGWLARIGDDLHDRLARAGLVEPRRTATVADLVDAFFAARTDAKPASKVVWGHVGRDLRAFFGGGCRLADIDRERAQAFRQHLTARGLAATTVHKRLQFARQFFRFGVDCGMLPANPFERVSHKAGNPTERRRYVTDEETQRLIDAAPDWTWRIIIALARFGGLRCPSEVLSLRWEDVDLPAGRMTVRSPKTEGHAGGGRRAVPIFARLRPYLEEAWDMAAEGQTHVVPEDRYLPAAHGPSGWVNCNLRTTLDRIIRRAGLEPWPRLFHNLRASCETDLAAEFPIATVCQWIGNTVAIAARHYVQATDADFQRAAGVVPNPGLQTHEMRSKPSQGSFGGIPQGVAMQGITPGCSGLQTSRLDVIVLELGDLPERPGDVVGPGEPVRAGDDVELAVPVHVAHRAAFVRADHQASFGEGHTRRGLGEDRGGNGDHCHTQETDQACDR